MRRTSAAALGIGTLLLATLAVAPAGSAMTAPDAVVAESATPLSATVSEGGHTISYLVGGGAIPGTGDWSGYDAVVPGGRNITLVGALSYSLEDGYSTLLTQRATLGEKTVSGYEDEYIGGGTYTTPFNLLVTAPKIEGKGVVRTLYAKVGSRNCNYYGVCGGPVIDVSIGVLGTGTDLKPPTIEALRVKGKTRIGERTRTRFAVTDNRKKARVFATLFSDGTAVMSSRSPSLVQAVGETMAVTWPYPKEGTGPFYVCFWAKDKAGNVSKGAPYSACRWLSIQVKVPRVSNGCGGSAWGDEAADLMNWFGDTRTYGDQTVSFRAACNQHDAGYDGATVAGLGTTTLTDFRTWTRDEVDTRFGQDLMRQCNVTLPGPKYAAERAACLDEVPIYLGLVRQYGAASFDADVTTHGEQTVTPSSTLPPGGARDNR